MTTHAERLYVYNGPSQWQLGMHECWGRKMTNGHRAYLAWHRGELLTSEDAHG